MISALAGASGLALGDRSMPAWLADMIGAVCETTWRLFGLKGAPPLTKHAAMVMSRNCSLIDAKARAELAYRPVISREAGLAEMCG
jgi:nucleoside-diphosphate-sugar epimerase